MRYKEGIVLWPYPYISDKSEITSILLNTSSTRVKLIQKWPHVRTKIHVFFLVKVKA